MWVPTRQGARPQEDPAQLALFVTGPLSQPELTQQNGGPGLGGRDEDRLGGGSGGTWPHGHLKCALAASRTVRASLSVVRGP